MYIVCNMKIFYIEGNLKGNRIEVEKALDEST